MGTVIKNSQERKLNRGKVETFPATKAVGIFYAQFSESIFVRLKLLINMSGKGLARLVLFVLASNTQRVPVLISKLVR